MGITALVGPPGSGKSRRLITQAVAARAGGREVMTLVCSEYPWPSNHGAFWVHRQLVCRQPGMTFPITHFVSATDAAGILRSAAPGSLVAIEEAYAFGVTALEGLCEAERRGVEVILAAPSYHQRQLAGRCERYEEIAFSMTCQNCSIRDGVVATIRADDGQTETLCKPCFEQRGQEARAQIVEDLRAQDPYPGEDFLYQPIEIPEVAGWRMARPDTLQRAKVVFDIATSLGIVAGAATEPPSYLDVGCNTGSFCDYFASRGYRAKGVDATLRFIRVARLMDSYVRRQQRPGQQFATFELASAYDYLRDTQQEKFDVTSAFAVFQWVMIQKGSAAGLDCIKWLAAKTRRVCFLEMGYTKEEMYKHQLDVEIDRQWVERTMRELGGFSEIRVVNASKGGLQRDLFVGIK